MSRYLFTLLVSSFSLVQGAPTLSNAVFANYRDTNTPAVLNQVLCNSAGGGVALQCGNTVALSDTGGLSLTFSAFSEGTFGSLRASAEADITGAGSVPAPRFSVVRGGATYTDDYLFTGQAPGTSGIALWRFNLTGNSSGFGTGNLAHVSMNAIRGASVLDSVTRNTAASVILATPIVFGELTTISFNMVALININQFFSGLHLATLWDNTAVLGGLSVVDSSGAPISFDVTGAAQSQYLVDLPGAIPEPSTWVLASCGLAMLLWRRLR